MVVDGKTIGNTDDKEIRNLTKGTLTVAGKVAEKTLNGEGSGITGVAAT